MAKPKRKSQRKQGKTKNRTGNQNWIDPRLVKREINALLRDPELNYLSKEQYEKAIRMLKPYDKYVPRREAQSVKILVEGVRKAIETEKARSRSRVYDPIVREILAASGEPELVENLENMLEKAKQGTMTLDEVKSAIEKTKRKYAKRKKKTISNLLRITDELAKGDDEIAVIARKISEDITTGKRPSRIDLEKILGLAENLGPKKRKDLKRVVKEALKIYRN